MVEEMSRSQVLERPGSARWDYSVLTLHSRHNEALEQALTEKGRDGWEVVFMAMPMPYEYQCVFKRPS